MSKSKIKLQPIAVRNPLPQGASIPVLPLPHEELITRHRATIKNKVPIERDTGSTAYTGISNSGNDITRADAKVMGLEKRDQTKSNNRQDRVRVAFPELPPYIEGKARDVWRFLAEKVVIDEEGNGRGLFVRATRREIAKGAGIGSLDTVDRSLARLQGLGFIDVERSRGVNEGSVIKIKSPDRHPQNEENAWQEIANVLEQSANLIKKKGSSLSPNELIQWSGLTDRAFRLLNNERGR